MQISRPWKQNKNMSLHIFYTAAWNVLSWSGTWKFNGESPVQYFVYLFPVLGLVMLYSCVAHWFNETKFKFEDDFFVVEKSPVPWGTSTVKIPMKEIKQAYVQEYKINPGNETHSRYRLIVQLHSHQEVVIDSDIRHYPDAKQLEHWLEKNVGIEDQTVPGEVGYLKVA